MGVPQNIMRALCAVIRPDHFKFASYGPAGCVLIEVNFDAIQEIGPDVGGGWFFEGGRSFARLR